MHKFVDFCFNFDEKNLHLADIFSHHTLIFLNKLMMYGVVQQVYGVLSPDSVVYSAFISQWINKYM